ncbi:MAG: DUF5695 domain-containing protein [Gemmatimonadota bacterium]
MTPVGWMGLFLGCGTLVLGCVDAMGEHRPTAPLASGESRVVTADWTVDFSPWGITRLTHTPDPHQANALAAGGRLGLVDVLFQVNDGDRMSVFPSHQPVQRREVARGTELTWVTFDEGMPFSQEQRFTLGDTVVEWEIELENQRRFPVRIGDLAIRFPWRSPSGSDSTVLFEESFTKRHFISGDASFLLFAKPGGASPLLLVTVKPGTQLEYFTSEGSDSYRAFIHSAFTGGETTEGSWRQPHTEAWLAPAGEIGAALTVGFRLHWARSYQHARDILAREGLLDVRVVPGMTVPTDLEAHFAVRSAAVLDSVVPEFPNATQLEPLGTASDGSRLFRTRFRRLGENLLTIHFDGDRQSQLEFFVTEPIETLLAKRSAFITERQLHRDPDVWYDGLFSIYDMKNGVLRGPDDTDGYEHWWGYVLASDDPALGKAPYVASWNALFPHPEEIAALEYHLERFVWGGLQRTDAEDPYPYGIHGVPNFRMARSDSLRATFENRRLDRMKIWRSYDYPHVFMLYYHMYQIAERYPEMVNYLDADGYFERMWQTVRAFFLYPYEIYPWYDIYKWGFYNELLVPEIIALLEERGRAEDASWLRGEWEKKAKYFIYHDPYPYRSEYPIDRTAYESSHALARYGATTPMEPDQELWYDVNEEVWRSHPRVTREAARDFMERQLQANLSMRGWLEPKYFLLGGDFTSSTDRHGLSYMSRMGGWSVLDHALHFAREPWELLQLGYASYLASFALMNTGREETDYGYWFPGPQNDGAVGWAFMDAKYGRAWIQKDEARGAWRYDGEADLGLGAVTRTAATVLANDPVFGWVAYGGELSRGDPGSGGTEPRHATTEPTLPTPQPPQIDQGPLAVIPRDGVRTRFWWVDGEDRWGLELERDGWARESPIVVGPGGSRVEARLENRTGTSHTTWLRILTPGGADLMEWEPSDPAGTYASWAPGTAIPTTVSGPGLATDPRWTVIFDGVPVAPIAGPRGTRYPLEMADASHSLVVERR